ncbi:chemotaxis protein CheW [Umboniibacter marinipuniceus]|uniref:CheW-like protein n=1 Tax=Umboniibacter marinipuniceus TaxID=569599 RepID=A0A3M0AAQ3_9GAMM|nr:chemotaxis protein CheW [Umboniibacter marinipuniceus]RMA82233.1 CheW-like protein [Umboniibacter marinipuniceus]
MSFVDHPLLEKPSADIPTLLMSLGEMSVALPTMSVAEIVSGVTIRPVKDGPKWLAGEVRWRERAVPLIDLQYLATEREFDYQDGAPIAVLNSAGGSDHYRFFAIRLQTVPRILRLMAPDLAAVENVTLPGMTMALQIHEQQYWLPDLVEIEQHWIEYVEQLAKR